MSAASEIMPLPQQRDPADATAASSERTRDAFEWLSDVAQLVAGSLDLGRTLQAVARAVVASLGFEAAVVNLVREDGVVVAALEGPADMRAALAGTVQPLSEWQQLLELSRPFGTLRFVDGRSQPDIGEVLAWVPDLPVDGDPQSWHPLDALFAPLHGTDGELIGVLSVDLPVDGMRPGARTLALIERFARQAELAIDRARTHEQLAESEELFRRSFESTPIGMALLDADGHLLRVNPAFAELASSGVAKLTGASIYDLVPGLDVSAVRRTVDELLDGESDEFSGDVQVAGRWLRVHAGRIDSRHGTRVLLHVVDITEMRESREALRRRAETDPLTGALNRDALQQEVRRMSRESGEGSGFGFLFVDIDMFKLVNDSHGHHAGDEVLRTLADRMRGALRADDLLCRFGGDEFVVCLPDVNGPAHAIDVAERLLEVIGQRIEIGGTSLLPSASIGITVGGIATDADVERLLAAADTALYRAKDAGRGRWELYQPWMSERDQAQLGIRSQVQRALDGEEFRLYYQPIVDMHTEQVLGYEALLRWEYPERGLLPPADFLPELFSGPLAAAATDWVLERAVADAATWRVVTKSQPPWVSVNVHPDQLGRPEFAERVLACLQRHSLPAERLVIELLEQSLPSGDEPLAQLDKLRAAGVGIAIDDLGSGYAGLLTLRQVPATVVKLDMDFTRSIGEATTAAIVRAVVELASTLGITLIVEGIEHPESAARLMELGVRIGQGYLFGAPAHLASKSRRPVHAPNPRLQGDFAAERRKLDAALAMATDVQQVAQVAVQAATRVSGASGGSLVELSGDGEQLATRFAVGIDPEMVAKFPSFSVKSPLPLALAVRNREPLFWEPGEARQKLKELLGDAEYLVSLAALPLIVPGSGEPSRVWGGLGLLWPEFVEIGEPLSAYLLDLAERVAARLGELRG